MTDATLHFESDWHAVVNAFSILTMCERPDESVVDSRQTDAGLVAAALMGDSDAFGRIIERHQGTIATQMLRFSRDQTVVEELAHDVFVEAYLSLKTYRARSPLIHWLRKIAVRVGYRYWQRQARDENQTVAMSEVGGVFEQLESEPGIDTSQANEVLHDLLKLLSSRDRLVLTLMYWDGCSIAETAELAGWTKTMTKVQAYRARKRLKHLIEESTQ